MNGDAQLMAADAGDLVRSNSFDVMSNTKRACVAIPLTRWSALLGAIELSGFALASLLTSPHTNSSQTLEDYIWPATVVYTIVWMFVAQILGLYGRDTLLSGARANARQGILAATLALGLLLLLAFMSKMIGPVSRVWFLSWIGLIFVIVVSIRLSWSLIIERALRQGYCIERAVVIADSMATAAELGELLGRESSGQVGVVFSMAVPESDWPNEILVIEHAIRTRACDRIILGGFEQKLASFQRLLDRLALIAVDITVVPGLIVPGLAGLGGAVTRVDRIGNLPAVGVMSHPLTALQSFLKRAEDLVIATLALVFFAPILAAVAIGIRLDSRGPVFFTQVREGHNGRVFKLFKFRTMYVDMTDRAALRQTSRNDPRVTRFGTILRRTSLDELPQLLNVLRGEMSIVGPRPHALGMTALGMQLRELLHTYDARHRLRPGITGWAQVRNCRGEITTVEKLRQRVFLDCDYINRWSLALDFWIIFKTILLVFNDRDAY